MLAARQDAAILATMVVANTQQEGSATYPTTKENCLNNSGFCVGELVAVRACTYLYIYIWVYSCVLIHIYIHMYIYIENLYAKSLQPHMRMLIRMLACDVRLCHPIPL